MGADEVSYKAIVFVFIQNCPQKFGKLPASY
jgi:hypothetical protein